MCLFRQWDFYCGSKELLFSILAELRWWWFNIIAHLFSAEKFLETIEGNSNYSILLLHIVDNASFDDMVRLAAAITFKNFVKRQWRVVSIFL
jgi:hypothetical protein